MDGSILCLTISPIETSLSSVAAYFANVWGMQSQHPHLITDGGTPHLACSHYGEGGGGASQFAHTM